MSVKVISRVWENSRQSGTALLVLLALADWADDWGYCYPGHSAIARKARTTERNVYMLLKKLEEEREIQAVRRGFGGRNRVTSVYQVVVGMTEDQIHESLQFSPIAKEVSPENISPENISPENSRSALNVLINRHINAADSLKVKQQQFDGSPEEISPENFSGEKSFTENQRKNETLPPEIRDRLNWLGWRGPLGDVEKAWQEDPERVNEWLWYAKRNSWSCALLRTVLRSPGEYPPELNPNGEAYRKRLRDSWSEFLDDEEEENA